MTERSSTSATDVLSAYLSVRPDISLREKIVITDAAFSLFRSTGWGVSDLCDAARDYAGLGATADGFCVWAHRRILARNVRNDEAGE